MSNRLQEPLHGDADDAEQPQSKSEDINTINTHRLKPASNSKRHHAKKRSKTGSHSSSVSFERRARSSGSLNEAQRRQDTNNNTSKSRNDRFGEKELHIEQSGIGLYSPLVSVTQSRSTSSSQTIYHGVPRYLNPTLMRQRTSPSRQQRAANTVAASSSSPPAPKSMAFMDDVASDSFGDYPLTDIKASASTQQSPRLHAHSHTQGAAAVSDSSKPLLTSAHAQPFKPAPQSSVPAQAQEHVQAKKVVHSPSRTVWGVGMDMDDPSKDPLSLEPFVKTAPQKRLLDDFNELWNRAYIALIVLAVFNALIAFAISKVASFAWELASVIYDYEPFRVGHGVVAYLLTLALKLSLVLSAIFLTRQFAPGCAGSGVPELRAILSGIWIRHYLSKTTFVTKICALTLSLCSGLPIGLEGPFIHLSSIMARQITKLKVFAHLDRKQMLSAACAGGLASVFGAPIGGVLFSIEVTSTYYPVTNYWTAFGCAMVGSMVTNVLQRLSPTSILLYENSFSDAATPRNTELMFFAVLGLVSGVVGVGFVYAHDMYVHLRRKYQSRYLGDNPYGIAIVVVLLFTTALFFIGDFAIEPARKGVADMFNISFLDNCDDAVFQGNELECSDCHCVAEIVEDDMTRCQHNRDDIVCQQNDWCHCYYHDWVIHFGLFANLISFYVLNFFFTICSVTLSYPCGVFSPIFTLGAFCGRLFGELFRLQFAYCDPRVYAVVGAAAMAASVTQTISPAVIALEITQDLSLAVPCLLAVIISAGLSGSLTHSFYDSVLQLRGIPMLPIRPTSAYKRVILRPKTQRMRSLPQQKGSVGNLSSDADVFEVEPERAQNTRIRVLRKNVRGDKQSHDNDYDRLRSEDHPTSTAADASETMYRLLIADDVMLKEFLFVTIDPDADELVHVLTHDAYQEWFPIVHTVSESVLVGETRRSVLMDLLQYIDRDRYEQEIPADLKMSHLSFYDQSETQIKDKASIMNDASLLSETMGRRTANKKKTQAKLTQKLAIWKRSNDQDSAAASDGEEEKVSDYEDSASVSASESEPSPQKYASDEHRVKMTLMSPGFIERINLSPIQVISEMPLTKIYTLFHILKPQSVYVTKYSRLIGVITELNLLRREFEAQQTLKRARLYCLKCKKVCNDCKDTLRYCCCDSTCCSSAQQ